MRVGRPAAYKKEYAEQAKKLCELGAIDADLAKFFKVAISTISRWKLMYAEFSEALKAAKDQADVNVEKALYQRATGYSCPDTDIKVIDSQIVKTKVTRRCRQEI